MNPNNNIIDVRRAHLIALEVVVHLHDDVMPVISGRMVVVMVAVLQLWPARGLDICGEVEGCSM